MALDLFRLGNGRSVTSTKYFSLREPPKYFSLKRNRHYITTRYFLLLLSTAKKNRHYIHDKPLHNSTTATEL